MKKIILLASLIILTFSGCDIVNKYLKKDIATQVTGTWEGQMEVSGFLNQKETIPVMVHINFHNAPYFLQLTTEGKEVLKMNVSKIIEHQKDNAMEYFNEKGTSSAYLVVNDDDSLQMKGPGNLRLNLKKIVSTY